MRMIRIHESMIYPFPFSLLTIKPTLLNYPIDGSYEYKTKMVSAFIEVHTTAQ